MPYEKEHYREIPRLILSHSKLDVEAQLIFIDSLDKEELLSLLAVSYKSTGELEDFPTPLHVLFDNAGMDDDKVAISVKVAKLLLDKFLEIQSQQSEAKEEPVPQKKIFDDIAKLPTSKKDNLLHLITYCIDEDDLNKFLELVSPNILADAALQKNDEGIFAFGCVARNLDSSAFFAFFDKLSPAVKDKVFDLKSQNGDSILLDVLEFQHASVVRLFIDNIHCPFQWAGRISTLTYVVDRNKNLSESEKGAIETELWQMSFFMVEPWRAVYETPDALLDFVYKYFSDNHKHKVDFKKWFHFLREALNASDVNDKVNQPLLVFTIQAMLHVPDIVINNCDRMILYLRLFKLRETQFLNSSGNTFVGECFTLFGSPLKSAMLAYHQCGREMMVVASQDYNAVFRNGLEHLKKAADSKHAEAGSLLTKLVVPFELTQETAPIVVTERKSEPEDKAKPIASVVTFFREAQLELKQSNEMDKKFEEMVKQLNERANYLDQIDWSRLSLQFGKAIKEKFQVGQLAYLKHCIERAEMGSDAQRTLLEKFYNQLEDDIRNNPKKPGVLLSFIMTDPYTAWLSATRAITRECRRLYYDRIPLSVEYSS